MEDFLKLFEKMMISGFVGVYLRIDKSTDSSTSSTNGSKESYTEKSIPVLAVAAGCGAVLNLKLAQNEWPEQPFPETETGIFEMFENPLDDVTGKLPEEEQQAIAKKRLYTGRSPLIEKIDYKGHYTITGEGYEFLSDLRLADIVEAGDTLGEFTQKQAFAQMKNGAYEDYVYRRSFLETNAYIPMETLSVPGSGAPAQTEEQRRFMEKEKDLFRECYEQHQQGPFYVCPNCGLILKQDRSGRKHCISKWCNAEILKKEPELVQTGRGLWILKDPIARAYYYPGRLEQQIKAKLDKAQKDGRILSYKLWPGNNPYVFDTWDFRIELPNGRSLLMDAKDVESPGSIINDYRVALEENEKLYYVVPNERTKSFCKVVNQAAGMAGEATCILLKELDQTLERENEKL